MNNNGNSNLDLQQGIDVSPDIKKEFDEICNNINNREGISTKDKKFIINSLEKFLGEYNLSQIKKIKEKYIKLNDEELIKEIEFDRNLSNISDKLSDLENKINSLPIELSKSYRNMGDEQQITDAEQADNLLTYL